MPGVVSADRYGTSGQRQDGIDIVVELEDGTYFAIQARRTATVSPKNLTDAAREYRAGSWASRSTKFVYATSASAQSTRVRERIIDRKASFRAAGSSFEVWDGERLSRRLKAHPAIVRDFFGAVVLDAFLPEAAVRSMAVDVAHHLRAEQAKDSETNAAWVHASATTSILDLALVSLTPDVREIVQDLKVHDPSEAAQLTQAVGDDPPVAIGLIYVAPVWVERGSWALLDALGRLATAAGHYAAAEVAFRRASDTAPADTRPLMLVRAHHAAEADGRERDARQLLQFAATLEPDHLAVRVAQLRKQTAGTEQLAALRQLVATTPKERESVAQAEVEMLLELDRIEEAEDLIGAWLQVDPSSMWAIDRRIGIRLWRVATSTSPSRPDRAELLESAKDSVALRERLLARGRSEESGRILARGAECLSAAGAKREARELLLSVEDDETSHRSVRTDLADAYLHSGDLVSAQSLLPEGAPASDREKALVAHILALSEDADDRQRAYGLGQDVLESDTFGPRGALAMIIVAAADAAFPWSKEAFAAVEARAPWIAPILRSERLDAEGTPEKAEALLLANTRHLEVLEVATRRLIGAGHDVRARPYAEQLAHRDPSGEHRMMLAGVLHRLDLKPQLREQLHDVVGDTSASPESRSAAFQALHNELGVENLSARDRLTRRWVAALPDDELGHWHRAATLVDLTRYDDALTVIETAELFADSVGRARLMALVFGRALPATEAVRRLGALSRQFGDEDESLTGLFLVTALRADAALDDELTEQVRETLDAFTMRFPQSKILRPVKIDFDDPTRVVEALREATGATKDRSAAIAEATNGVLRGLAPVSYLASIVGRSINDVSQRLGVLPLAYGGSPRLRAEEASAATEATGTSAVWDPLSLIVVASLNDEVRAAILAGLPGSRIARSTLAEADNAVQQLPNSGDDHQDRVSTDEGRLTVDRLSRTALEIDRRTAEHALILARSLSPLPDVDPELPDELDAALRSAKRPSPYDTFPATLSAARRLGLPVFSDDRAVRSAALALQIPAFGTLDLLDALVARDLLPSVKRDEARLVLLRRGAVGVQASAAERSGLAAGSTVGDTAWTSELVDPASWERDTRGQLRACVEALRAIWGESPRLLTARTDLLLRETRAAFAHAPQVPSAVASSLLTTMWLISEPDPNAKTQRAFSTAVTEALASVTGRGATDPFEVLTDAVEFSITAVYEHAGINAVVPVTSRIMKQLRFPLDLRVLLTIAPLLRAGSVPENGRRRGQKKN